MFYLCLRFNYLGTLKKNNSVVKPNINYKPGRLSNEDIC